MALTVLQNSQRITILMFFFTLLIVIILLTIRIIKKKIDLDPPHPEPESAGPQYQEAQSQQNIIQFQNTALHGNEFSQYDTCTERFMKKMGEVNVTFNPLLLALPLSFVMGRTYAFSIAIYFAAALFCLLFNVFKIHRACIEYRASRLFLESIWICLALLLLVNIWVTDPSSMLYLLHD